MNVKKIRKNFPILNRKINGKPLVYLDNAATTQKPRSVLHAIMDFYENHNANAHRGKYVLSEEASALFDSARQKVSRFVKAGFEETVFTKNATESLNLLAFSLARQSILKKGDIVLLSHMEHHANLVPWIELKKRIGIRLEFVPLTDHFELDLQAYEKSLRKKPKVVSITHCSNVLGTINPVQKMARMAHDAGALFITDAAQSVPHLPIDFKKLGVDFLVFSSHKMLGPNGIGVLVGKKDLLENLPPFLTGGEMISEVFWDRATWNELPLKFEAGTQDFAGAVGLGAAVDYLQKIGMDFVAVHEKKLGKKTFARLSNEPGIELYSPSPFKKCALFSFNVSGVHPHDVATVLDSQGIAVRSGNHCAQPLLRELGAFNTVRASFYLYNTASELEQLIGGLQKTKKMFGIH